MGNKMSYPLDMECQHFILKQWDNVLPENSKISHSYPLFRSSSCDPGNY